jgi:elongation factor P--(R)-beta-lysine ligase
MSTREKLTAQAGFVSAIREYFVQHGVLPVRTHLLGDFGSTDPSVCNMSATDESGTQLGFLQTSPEFAMKRLLSEGSGDIYQICAAFRAEEAGRLHRPEFSILEWYRLGFDHHQLMDDVEALVNTIVPNLQWRRCSYRELFKEHVGIDPHSASNELLFTRANLSVSLESQDLTERSLLLDIIFSQQIQPTLSGGEALFVYDFPHEQAAYAIIRDTDPPVASRFELLIGDIEIANGYHEVTDGVEQARRHARERGIRAKSGQKNIEIDPKFLSAFEKNMPECAGVAIGLDRLMMISFDQNSLKEAEIL